MGTRGLLVVGIVCSVLVHSFAFADEPTTIDGTLELKTTAVDIGVGYRWGEGVLKFGGKEYPFSIDGLSVGAVGANKAQVLGDVLNLKKVEDFSGVYRGASVNALIVAGGGGNELTNEKGVVLRLSRTTVGLTLQVGADGLKIALKDAK